MSRDAWRHRPPDIGQLCRQGLLKIHGYPHLLTKQGLLEVYICDLLRHEGASELRGEYHITLAFWPFYKYAQRLLHEGCPTETVVFSDQLRKPADLLHQYRSSSCMTDGVASDS